MLLDVSSLMMARQARYVRRYSTLSVRFCTSGKENCSTNMERTLELKRSRVTPLLFGIQDGNLRYLVAQLGVHSRTHDAAVTVVGESAPTLLTVRLLEGAYSLLEAGLRLDLADLGFLVRLLENGEDLSPQTLLAERIAVPSQKRFISPKSLGQRRYLQAIRRHDLVIGIGPAGTGKTYLAMAMAVAELERKECSRIILARPAVEAGEKLGFLPGDLLEKVNPYLRPLYDAHYDMLDFEKAQRLLERGAIEVAPLAFMRGRTLNDSFIILDEAQNATVEQMKMFLTRIGFGSKVVVTGDVTQIDVVVGRSGLVGLDKVVGG